MQRVMSRILLVVRLRVMDVSLCIVSLRLLTIIRCEVRSTRMLLSTDLVQVVSDNIASSEYDRI